MGYKTGPILVFRSFTNDSYNISILRITDISNYGELKINDNIIDSYEIQKLNYYFRYYDVTIKLKEYEFSQIYTFSEDDTKYTFLVPTVKSQLRLLYYSCNNKSSDMENNWNLCKSYQTNNHLMIGGGDQIYADDVFNIPCIEKLMNNNEDYYEISQKIKDEITKFYIETYLSYYNISSYRKLLYTLPSINILDDHDIFDGYGSYNENIQNSPIVKEIFKIAYDIYLLFQLHVTEDTKDKYDFFGECGYNKIYKFNDTMIIAIDHRAERTQTNILHQNTEDILNNKIKNNDCKYNIFLIGIPLFFPHDTTINKIIVSSKSNKILENILIKCGGKSVFGEFEGMDDIVYDSWSCDNHIAERNRLLNMMYELNGEIIILCGDSHIGGLAKCTKNNKTIYQIMSSGIGSEANTKLTDLLEIYVNKNNKYMINDMEINYIKLWKTYFIKNRNWIHLRIDNTKIFESIMFTEKKSMFYFDKEKYDGLIKNNVKTTCFC
jgi:hypothetical protein